MIARSVKGKEALNLPLSAAAGNEMAHGGERADGRRGEDGCRGVR